jgi:hypothetical protein
MCGRGVPHEIFKEYVVGRIMETRESGIGRLKMHYFGAFDDPGVAQ